MSRAQASLSFMQTAHEFTWYVWYIHSSGDFTCYARHAQTAHEFTWLVCVVYPKLKGFYMVCVVFSDRARIYMV